MRNLCLTLSLLISVFSFSQNLLNNPGFENNFTNWGSFWSRDGQGSATIVASPVHGGTKAAKIVYPSTQDWAVSYSTKINVTPGEVYELSCWIKTDSIVNGAVNFSVVLWDASNNALNWSYSPCTATATAGNYKYYVSKFMIPTNVATIQPRFMGDGKCAVVVDDASLTKSTTASISGNYSFENTQIKGELKLPELTLKFTNKKSQKSYQIQSSNIMAVSNVQQPNAYSLILQGKYINVLEDNFEIHLTAIGKSVKIEMKGDSAISWNSDNYFPGPVYTQSGEYLIIPKGTGIIIPVEKQYPYYDFRPFGWSSTLPFIGVTNLTDGYMLATDDQWDAYFGFNKPSGQNQYYFLFKNLAAKGVMSYNRTSHFVVVDSGYVEMCQWYRTQAETLGYAKTFTQKKIDNADIDKLIGAVNYWDIFTNLSSNGKTLDTLRWMGMDKAVFSLEAGWQGGNNSAAIDTLNKKGFISSRYDIYTDVWPVNSNCTGYRTAGYPQDVVVQQDGNLQEGWLAYCNSNPYQGYYLCSRTHQPYCASTIQNDLNINKYNGRFIDVEMASNLGECYSNSHPLTRKQDGHYRNELLKYVKENKQLITGVEQAHDFSFPYADFGEGTMSIESTTNAGYDWATPDNAPPQSYVDNNIKPTLRVPLHGLSYHDVHIPTWYTGDGASKVPSGWEDKNLWNILYSSMPLYMPDSKSYWYKNFSKFICGYNLMTTVTRSNGYSKMTYHKFITPDWNVQQTSFESGWNVTVNFNSTPYTYAGKNLAPKGFYASGPSNGESYKLIEGTDTVSFAYVNDRLFLQTHGASKAKSGVQLNGIVFIQNFGSYLLVAFIGNQSFVDLNPAQMPWGINTFTKASVLETGVAVALSPQSGGWIRLNKTNGKKFYKLEYSSTTDALEGLQAARFSIQPNPTSGLANLYYTLREDSEVKIEIADLTGKIHQQNSEGNKSAGEHSALIPTEHLPGGIYFITLLSNNARITQKLIIVNR